MISNTIRNTILCLLKLYDFYNKAIKNPKEFDYSKPYISKQDFRLNNEP